MRDVEDDRTISSTESGNTEELPQGAVTRYQRFSPELVERLWPEEYKRCEKCSYPTTVSASEVHDDGRISLSKLAALMNSEKCNVFVGSEQTQFVVPYDVLCYTSAFFRHNIISTPGQHARMEIKLADITCEAFDAVLECAISGFIRDVHQRGRDSQDWKLLLDKHWNNLPPLEERMNLMPAMEIYLAAEKLQMELVREEAMALIEMAFLEDKDRWLDLFASHPELSFKMRPGLSLTLLQDLLARTTPNSGLWHLLCVNMANSVMEGYDRVGNYRECLILQPKFAFDLLGVMQEMLAFYASRRS